MRLTRRACLAAAAWVVAGPSQAGAFEDFFKAVELDNPSAVIDLALRGFDLNTPNEAGDTPLIAALRSDSLKVAQLLAEQRAVKVDPINRAGENALMIAAIRGHLGVVRTLLQRGAEVNRPGWAPLHYAASHEGPNALAIAELLLQRYAYIDAESPNGSTPLMMAARYGSSLVVELLLKEGADATLKNRAGLNAADFARSAGRDRVAETIARQIRDVGPKTW